jgi:hypothetical protein
MIDISPLVDEDNWGGKRWLDARPFDWGDDEINTGTIYNPSSYRSEKVLYEKIYKALGQ